MKKLFSKYVIIVKDCVLILILILIPIKTRIENIFGQNKPPQHQSTTHRELNLA